MLISVVLGLAVCALADIPRLITIQGRLTDDTGTPVPDGDYDIVYTINDDSLAGAQLWKETQPTSVSAGLFTVQLGVLSTLADSIFRDYQDIFVGFRLKSDANEFSPRIRMTSSTFAFHALIADSALAGPSAMGSGWIDNATVVSLVDANDQVGIGTASPSAKLDVTGSGNRMIRAHNATTSGTATGVYGSTASTSGRGLLGSASAETGYPAGVEGYAVSPNGYAFYGFNEAESGEAYVFYGENHSPDGIAIFGTANADEEYSTGIGVYGRSHSDFDGTGVYGEVTNTGITYGVRGVAAYGDGVRGDQTASGNHGSLGRAEEGVYGRGFGGYGDGVHGVAANTAPGKYGVGLYGQAYTAAGGGVLGVWDGDTTTGQGYGGYFATYSRLQPALIGVNGSPSEGATGVLGYSGNNADLGYGVIGEAQSADGRGVYGHALSASGVNFGVYGETAAIGGRGVYGTNTGMASLYACAIEGERIGTGVGVRGIGGTHGVVGIVEPTGSQSHYGVLGRADGGSGTNYGVYGGATGDGTNYAGYFSGNVEVTGTLSKGGGSFKIDHPLDPEHKYLHHSFVESPDMKNIYDGIAVTGDDGYATVTLPNWFQALNRDFRYQLTVIDEQSSDDFVLAKVTHKIEHNQFVIRTSAPNIEVSWQITGIRQDRFAEANRIPVETDKPADELGTYLHPEAWGKPADLGVPRAQAFPSESLTPTGESTPNAESRLHLTVDPVRARTENQQR